MKKTNLIFVTFLGAGYIKFASGTFASLFTSIIFFYLFRFYISIERFPILCLIIILFFVYSFRGLQKSNVYVVIRNSVGGVLLPGAQTFLLLFNTQ